MRRAYGRRYESTFRALYRRNQAMTSQAENELLTRVGPGTPMGDLMRQYWLPACLSSELDGRRRPAAADAAGRAADRLPRQRRAGRRPRSPLPAPLRLAVLRPQRGGRPALRLSRLEVRHGRQLPRHAECAGRPGLPAQGQGQGLSRWPSAAGWSTSIWASATVAPPLPALEAMLCPAGRDQPVLPSARMQLAAGPGRRYRHLAFQLSAHRQGRSSRDIDPDHLERFQLIDRAPALSCQDDRLGHDVHRLPAGAARVTLLPLRPFRDAVLDAVSERPVERQHSRPGLGADGRHPHDVVPLQLEAQDPGAGSSPGPASRFRFLDRITATLPNTADWFGRWRPVANPEQRLPDRSRGAAHGQLHRDRRGLSAGFGGDREHGRNLRSHARASGAERPDDRHDAPAAARCRAGAARQGDRPAARRRSGYGERCARAI